MARVFISHSSRDEPQAGRLLEWLRAQGFTETFLDFDKHAGIAPGSDWERTLYREIARAEAVILILTANWFESKWCFAEFAQARALGKAIFPIVETPTGETFVAPDIQSLDLIKDRDGGLQRLGSELSRIALNARGGFPWDASRPVFPGLLAFDEADAAIYFGRDDEIRRVIERLNARRAQGGAKLVALLGASGAGKSSLLRAGVLPRLKRDRRNWIALPPFRPQLHPLDELAQAVALALGQSGDWRQWREAFAADNPEHALSDLARDLRALQGANEAQILISIDQAEELFATADKVEATRFFAMLDAALNERLPFMVLMALRSDYLGLLQQAPGLAAEFDEVSLKPMPLERVREIIEGPARVAGIAVEDALTAATMKDATTDDALPLLAFALRELYDRFAETGHLTLEAYRALGDQQAGLSPLENAVRRKADEVLSEAKPAPEDLQALKEAFVPALVRVNAEGEYVRRPARLESLPEKAKPLIERLTKARLLVLRQEGSSPVVEVAHEALLRKWPLLRGWLDEEREFLIGKDQLESDLKDWDAAPEGQKTEALLSGLKLTRAQGWLVGRPQQLTSAERVFIQASLTHHAAEAARRERLRRGVLIGSVAAALVFAVIAVVALWQYRVAQNARADAQQASHLAQREAESSKRSLGFALTATDSLAVDIVREMGSNFAIPVTEKMFFADRTDQRLGALLDQLDDPAALRLRYADLLTSIAFMLGDNELYAKAKERAERASELLSKGVESGPTAWLITARAQIALALGEIADGFSNKAESLLDGAKDLLERTEAESSVTNGSVIARALLASTRVALLVSEVKMEAALDEQKRAVNFLNDYLAKASPDRSASRLIFSQILSMDYRAAAISSILQLGDHEVRVAALRRDLERAKTVYTDGSDPEWIYYSARGHLMEGNSRFRRSQFERAVAETRIALDMLEPLLAKDRQNLRWRGAIVDALLDRANYTLETDDLFQVRVDLDAARTFTVSLARDAGFGLFNLQRSSLVDYYSARLAEKEKRDAVPEYGKILGRVDWARNDVRDPRMLNRIALFGWYGMEKAYQAAGKSDEALTSITRALELLQQIEELGGKSIFVGEWRYYLHADMLTALFNRGDQAAWSEAYKQATADIDYLVDALPNDRGWLASRAYLLGLEGDHLAKTSAGAAAVDLYAQAAKAQLAVAQREPRDLNLLSNFVYYQTERLKLLSDRASWDAVATIAHSTRLAIPLRSKTSTGAPDLAPYWHNAVSALEAAVAKADAGDAADPTIAGIRARLAHELGLAKEAADQIATIVTGGTQAGSESTKRLDLTQQLVLSDIKTGTKDGVLTVKQRLGWASRPPIAGAWRTLVGDELDAAIDRFRSAGAVGSTMEAERIQRVRTMPLPFYSGGALLEAEYINSGNLYVVTLLTIGTSNYLLNGQSAQIHQANAEAPLNLADAAAVTSYLEFFTSYVSGEAGSFHLVESLDQIDWAPNASVEKRLAVSEVLRPVVVWRDPERKDNWLASGSVEYSNALFSAIFRIAPTGMIEMSDDLPVAADLPIEASRHTSRGWVNEAGKMLVVSVFGESPVSNEIDTLVNLSQLSRGKRPATYLYLAGQAAALQEAIDRYGKPGSQSLRAAKIPMENAVSLYQIASNFSEAYRIESTIVREWGERTTATKDQDDSFAKDLPLQRSKLAQLALLIGAPQEALEVSDETLKANPQNILAKVQRAHAKAVLGDVDEALAIYRENAAASIDGKPWLIFAEHELGEIEASGQYPLAISEFRKALTRVRSKFSDIPSTRPPVVPEK